ncbi:group I intron-associated PD-(D/E)XK endonuclease [Halobaculum marinum]|uniref:Group I intron-associated PD-(D/E)XK endonuclease n=1 Tax=Halobaculum marinum TaxID=3031996 RepID=A0ABD5X1S3_9EURY|nr:group I intron-associated PD-(D/E)XK endonuclease [Halobaculum sp. DT55]
MDSLDEMPSHRKGDYTEVVVVAELKRRGISVSKPIGDNERYDLVVEANQKFWTLQVKTGSYRDDGINFRGVSQHTNASGNTYKSYDGDVDFFAVYCHELGSMYLVPEEEVGSNMFLRTAEPSQRHRNINWADVYEFDRNWPPDETTGSSDDVSTVVDMLEERGITIHKPVTRETYQLLLEADDGTRYRTAVEHGTINGGRIRFDPKCAVAGPDAIDLVLVYSTELDTLHLVRRDEYNTAISLRVAAPEQWNRDINWAEEYEFDARWPDDLE